MMEKLTARDENKIKSMRVFTFVLPRSGLAAAFNGNVVSRVLKEPPWHVG